MSDQYIQQVTAGYDFEGTDLEVQGIIVCNMIFTPHQSAAFEIVNVMIDRVYEKLDNGHYLPFDWEDKTEISGRTDMSEPLETFLIECLRENTDIEL